LPLLPPLIMSGRTLQYHSLLALHLPSILLSLLPLLPRSALQTSPRTTASDSDSSPASSPPPASQTAPPDAPALLSLPSSLASILPHNSPSLPLSSLSLTCLQKILSAL